jgi:hypothetical protein
MKLSAIASGEPLWPISIAQKGGEAQYTEEMTVKKFLLAATAVLGIGSAQADIINTVGLTIVSAPALVGPDFIGNSGGWLPAQLVFPEKQAFVLQAPLVTDTGTIAAGTTVDSYWFAVNNNAGPTVTVDTSIVFDRAVLGIIYADGTAMTLNPNFNASNFLGAAGTTYSIPADCIRCGFESPPLAAQDSASFTGDVAFFHTGYGNPGDFARIITQGSAVPVPGPTVGSVGSLLNGLLLAGIGLLALARRRQRVV